MDRGKIPLSNWLHNNLIEKSEINLQDNQNVALLHSSPYFVVQFRDTNFRSNDKCIATSLNQVEKNPVNSVLFCGDIGHASLRNPGYFNLGRRN